MVERGADIRYVQELLGHRDLSSTHIYTRVAPERLAAVHAATHPGAVLAGCHDSTGHDSTGHDSTGHDSTGHDSTGHDSTGHEGSAVDG